MSGPYREGTGTPPMPRMWWAGIAETAVRVRNWWRGFDGERLAVQGLFGFLGLFVVAVVAAGIGAIATAEDPSTTCRTACTDLDAQYVRRSDLGCFCRGDDGRGFRVGEDDR